ncbi:MAG TPA: RdgB/HAM1 family non-canonical purine NTP pyrophosphatase [Polyangiaceae bacterium]|jgi:XTP/dITP diphosphohydrolase|nr:RdgB/HAM1 family non-canonical purine NTP pyrophosphatase [Polyangiaceae bacterium]
MAGLLSLVIATTNEGKLNELRALLGDLPIELVTVNAVLGGPLSVSENGVTFDQNAIAKARAVCDATKLYALADDSGLEVDALDGRPGVRSARFAHERATDAENNATLLRELEDVVDDGRHAKFRCVLALASPFKPDSVETVEGSCEGTIARAPRGNGGFGYDPLFIVPELGGRAMAELSESEKNAVSHRARAVRALRPLLLAILDERLREVERTLG